MPQEDIHDKIESAIFKAPFALISHGWKNNKGLKKLPGASIGDLFGSILFSPLTAMFALSFHCVFYKIGLKALIAQRIAALITAPIWLTIFYMILPEAINPYSIATAAIAWVVVAGFWIYYGFINAGHPADEGSWGIPIVMKVLPEKLHNRLLVFAVINPLILFPVLSLTTYGLFGFSYGGGAVTYALVVSIVFAVVSTYGVGAAKFEEMAEEREAEKLAEENLRESDVLQRAITPSPNPVVSQTDHVLSKAERDEAVIDAEIERCRALRYKRPSHAAFHKAFWTYDQEFAASEVTGDTIREYFEKKGKEQNKPLFYENVLSCYVLMDSNGESKFDLLAHMKTIFSDDEIDAMHMADSLSVEEGSGHPLETASLKLAKGIDEIIATNNQDAPSDKNMQSIPQIPSDDSPVDKAAYEQQTRDAVDDGELTIEEKIQQLELDRIVDHREYVQGFIDLGIEGHKAIYRNPDIDDAMKKFFDNHASETGLEYRADNAGYMYFYYCSLSKDNESYVVWMDRIFEDIELERLWNADADWTGDVEDPLYTAQAKMQVLGQTID